jgi:predicted nucleic acid-binding protein
MRVYVETNFVLELALQQEQHEACEAILQLAEAQDIALILPACSAAEASTTLGRRKGERQNLLNEIARHLREIARMRGHAHEVEKARASMQALLLDTSQDAIDRLDGIIRRLQDSVQILPLSGADITTALALRTKHGLSYPDALVLASVLDDPELGRTTSCFLNRNTKDFDDPRIEALLAKQHCKLLGSFESGLQYIQAQRGQLG